MRVLRFPGAPDANAGSCPMGPSRVAGCVALAAAVGVGAAACTIPATALTKPLAGSRAAPAPGDRQTVTLVLTPPDRAGLQQLAHSPGVPRQTRSALLDRLRPTSGTRERVSTVARGLGLTVVNTGDPWAVTATGSAATIRAAFGSARASDPASPWARSLPRKPTALDGAVTAVLGGDETRPAKRPLLANAVRANVNVKVNAPTKGWTGS